jgi:hypothetical protein
MKTNIEIKSVGKAQGTVGWLKSQIESGKIVFEESNSYYIPPTNIVTHSLIMKNNKGDGSLIAYRDFNGEYITAEDDGTLDMTYDGCQTDINFTDAAKSVIFQIAQKWIYSIKEDIYDDEITVIIKR